MKYKKLRKVKDHVDIFLPEDHNDLIDNLKEAIKVLQDKMPKIDPTIIDKIDELKSIVDAMKYIKSGEFYYAEYHNKFVDAWNKLLPILDTLEKLVFIPKETYSVVAKARPRVTAVGIENLPYTESYSLTTGLITPSGADPYNPVWCPEGYWDEFWHFETQDEINDFATYISGSWYVENSLLKCSGSGAIERMKNIVPKRVVMAFKGHVTYHVGGRYTKASMIVNEGYDYWRAYVQANSDYAPNYIYCGCECENDTWYVLVYDHESKTCKLYKPDGTLLCEGSPGVGGTGSEYYRYVIRIENDGEDIEMIVEVDWIGVKY